MHTVYILKCSDDSTYVGCTGNLEERLKRHNKGEVSGYLLRWCSPLISLRNTRLLNLKST
ncbi:GIY-YIG nuclease family protein [Roseivirga seohaensis]|uniref:GIY-YIG nuclease family protein n=1 Tax=Roseivirga seohaensis TaxID=1914963 RepID=UPI001C880B31